jgi:hypothetical protein
MSAPTMTLQQMFDRIVGHLRTQNRQCKDQDACLYRGPEGNKCAVGCLITDEHYTEQLEGQNALDDDVVEALHRSIGRPIPGNALGMLVDLQSNVHDSEKCWGAGGLGLNDRGEQRIAQVADDYGLTYTAPCPAAA